MLMTTIVLRILVDACNGFDEVVAVVPGVELVAITGVHLDGYVLLAGIGGGKNDGYVGVLGSGGALACCVSG